MLKQRTMILQMIRMMVEMTEDASDYDGACRNDEKYAYADCDENVDIDDNQDNGQNDYDAGEHSAEDLDYEGHSPEEQDDYGPGPHHEDDSHYNEHQDHDNQDDHPQISTFKLSNKNKPKHAENKNAT